MPLEVEEDWNEHHKKERVKAHAGCSPEATQPPRAPAIQGMPDKSPEGRSTTGSLLLCHCAQRTWHHPLGSPSAAPLKPKLSSQGETPGEAAQCHRGHRQEHPCGSIYNDPEPSTTQTPIAENKGDRTQRSCTTDRSCHATPRRWSPCPAPPVMLWSCSDRWCAPVSTHRTLTSYCVPYTQWRACCSSRTELQVLLGSRPSKHLFLAPTCEEGCPREARLPAQQDSVVDSAVLYLLRFFGLLSGHLCRPLCFRTMCQR